MYYDPNQLLYRSYFTDELLDTKEKHMAHIKPYMGKLRPVNVKMSARLCRTNERLFAQILRSVEREAMATGASLNTYLLTIIAKREARCVVTN